jgi:predicted Rossmann-fold nucleotide-binding protein
VSPAPSAKGSLLPGFNLPYQPIRQHLYTAAELFDGFAPEEPASFARTLDFQIYRHFVSEGRGAPRNPYVGMMQALHDNAITQPTGALIAERRVAAIMGGHKMVRGSDAYMSVAVLARRLTRSGILVCSGGGPGGMEATHLGASLASYDDAALDRAVAVLKTQPVVPALGNIIGATGAVDDGLVAQAHGWFKPAYEVAGSLAGRDHSLAIPTWHYGHEPTTPFATHIAKYFQNSIREDGLLALARQGIVYAEGKAGTIQEIFQDGAQNYYQTVGHFSPMVLLGMEYWTAIYPVVDVLRKLFGAADFAKYVLVTDDVFDAARFIETFEAQLGII